MIKHRGKGKGKNNDKGNVNEQISAATVRVVDQDGNQIGIIKKEKALELAFSRGLDLVEVAPTANPPVCRIMDYGKYQYQQSKRAKEAKKKQHVMHLKEIKITPKTEEHDINFKIQHARKFLEEGNKVKITVRFRGRQLAHKDFGKNKLDQIVNELSEVGSMDREPVMEGRNLVAFLNPKKIKTKKIVKQSDREEN